MIQQIRKKPITVEAIQYDGHNHDEIVEWTGRVAYIKSHVGGASDGSDALETYYSLHV